MKISNRYKEAFERAKESPAYWTESALLDVARNLLARMKKLGVTQKTLAERMGRKAPYVNRVLSGRHNVTVETLSEAAHALGMRVDIRFEPLKKEHSIESITSGPATVAHAKSTAALRLVRIEPVRGTMTADATGEERIAA
ncbi:helix-turn-helix transcriptional regulator [Paraburkholderia sediminicola]|uniref:helix-turn-helix domain-containing protein n=1 Tax=Paraburkholderia sediminicola TaxID=458836 RepID=UPI0038BC9F3B